ncbi:glycosyltransferase family 4 protein [Sphingobium lignivorans]|uniref:Glycosyltransferase involved in cell wall biosynthesis n=1 Tax=Sphingobium lignivorans TaxID=2735886 RepID=A0ABR6NGD2_9SPHN|nr:glycosyltransferase family 4 protein [Sphingobium lignivorans]MBB5986330.1 glycosyltransferase involved in cell wall biosynthesis [Sphingobium lignivorans]
MTSRYRALLIAEAANPEWVSVPLVGWSLANAIRSVADAHIVTQVRNKAAFERAGLVEGRDFTAIDTEALMKPLWTIIGKLRGGAGKGWTTVTALQSLFYPLFESMVWRRFGKQIRAGEFDVVHRITPLSPTAPSLLAGRCARAGVPFVVGPLNGGIPWPRAFTRERHQEKEWLSYVRNAYKAMPGIKRTWRRSAAIIAGSRHTASELPEGARGKCIYIPENAIDPARFADYGQPDRYARLDLCFIGRLVPYKGPDVAIEAAQDLLRAGVARLTIIGDGPMMADLKALAARLGVADAVTFAGWVEHREVPEIARDKSVFLFPSVREFGGGAVIEAMALGLVPIIADYGGPAEIVTGETGFRLPIGSREIMRDRAAQVLAEMAAEQHDLAAMAARGRARIDALYSWERKAAQVVEVYDWVTGKRPDRPDFGF